MIMHFYAIRYAGKKTDLNFLGEYYRENKFFLTDQYKTELNFLEEYYQETSFFY